MTENLPTGKQKTLERGAIIIVPSPKSEALPPNKRPYLVIRRSATVPAPGKLCFPGGKCFAGETPLHAAKREFREEIGVEVNISREIWQNVTPWGVHLTWFLAVLTDPQKPFRLQTEEVAEVFWLCLEDLSRDPDTLISNTEFLEGALRETIDLELHD